MSGCLGNAFDDNIWLIILIAVIILCCFWRLIKHIAECRYAEKSHRISVYSGK